MYSGDNITLTQFSGHDRVVGAWLPDFSRECPDASEAAWFLTGRLTPNDAVRIIAIRVSPFCIGRDDGVNLSIPFPTVSRVHAEILAVGSNLELRDVASSNGTFINGRRIQGSVIIESDALLHFANVPFHVCLIHKVDMPPSCPAEPACRKRT